MSVSPSDDAPVRQELVDVMRRMHDSGLNRGTSGNASVRLNNGNGVFG